MKIIGIIILIAAIAAGLFYISQKTPSRITSGTNIVNTPTPSVDTSDLRAGGSSYNDPQGSYVFLYPSDYKIDQQNNGAMTRIYKTGPTQTGQTEMYDGVIVTFETVNLQGQTLSEWVDTSIKNSTTDGTTKVVVSKTNITHNKYPGFTYTLSGLGEAKYIVLQKDNNSPQAVVITTMVTDPQNLGFQQEVDKTLATLEILK